MKKISSEQFIAQLTSGLTNDIKAVDTIVEMSQEKRLEGYRQLLADMLDVMAILNNPPFKPMLHSLVQSAMDVKNANEAG